MFFAKGKQYCIPVLFFLYPLSAEFYFVHGEANYVQMYVQNSCFADIFAYNRKIRLDKILKKTYYYGRIYTKRKFFFA